MAGIVLRLTGVEGALKAVDRYAAKPLDKAISKATMAGARVAAAAIRTQTPQGETKRLVRSVRARRPRIRGVEAILGGRTIGTAIAGPNAPYRHLVIRGHRIVTPGGRDTGRRSRANPFVDRAVDAARSLIVEVVQRVLYRS